MIRSARNFWIETAMLFIVVIAIVAALLRAETAPLNRSQIKIMVGDLRSLTAGAALLVDQYRAGNVTQTFFETQMEDLESKAMSVERTLRTSKAFPDFEDARVRSHQTALQAVAEFESALGGPSDGTSNHLRSLSDQLHDLEDKLKNE